jgi:hypothetical protein
LAAAPASVTGSPPDFLTARRPARSTLSSVTAVTAFMIFQSTLTFRTRGRGTTEITNEVAQVLTESGLRRDSGRRTQDQVTSKPQITIRLSFGAFH